MAATIRDVYLSGGGAYIVAGANVFYQLQYGGQGVDAWTPESPLSPGGGPIPVGATGVRFRNAAAGFVATVSAIIRPRAQPFLTQTFVTAASTLNNPAPYFALGLSAPVATTSAAPAVLGWDAETYDTDDGHSNVTNNSRYTVKTAGLWELSCEIAWAANAVGTRGIVIEHYTAASVLVRRVAGVHGAPNPTGGEATTLGCSGLTKAATGEYFQATPYQVSGGALNVLINDPTFGMATQFEGCWLSGL